MKKLLAYINSLSKEERACFEQSIGTSISYIRKAASVGQQLNAETCTKIEQFSRSTVIREELRDNWMHIWPELIDQHRFTEEHKAA